MSARTLPRVLRCFYTALFDSSDDIFPGMSLALCEHIRILSILLLHMSKYANSVLNCCFIDILQKIYRVFKLFHSFH